MYIQEKILSLLRKCKAASRFAYRFVVLSLIVIKSNSVFVESSFSIQFNN